MLRRFLLVGVFIVIPRQGTVEQLAYGAVVAVVHLAFQVSASPFGHATDDFFASMCSMLLAVLFVCAIFYKYNTLTEMRDLQEVMSEEQIADYRPSPWRLSLILAGISVGGLVILFLIVVTQASEAAKQALAAQRAAKARRLRYVRNDQEVVPPPVGEGRYHILCVPSDQTQDLAAALLPMLTPRVQSATAAA